MRGGKADKIRNLTQIQRLIFLDTSETSRETGWSHDSGLGHTLTFTFQADNFFLLSVF